ncbi:MAG: hypothetical protein HC911_18190 [Chloroflexaceae bacterium]|nr:hypothetical protein [Chloroflexaceae bacterium]
MNDLEQLEQRIAELEAENARLRELLLLVWRGLRQFYAPVQRAVEEQKHAAHS